MRRFLVAVCGWLALAGSALASEQGVLCVGVASATADVCRPSAWPVTIEPTADEQRYVWQSDDHRDIVVGIVPRDANRDARPAAAGTTLVDLKSASSRWPSDVSISLQRGREATWKWTWRARDANGRHRLEAPVGRYVLTISAPTFAPAKREVTVTSKSSSAVTIAMDPLPMVTGRVIRTTKDGPVPVPFTSVLLPDDSQLAMTGTTGSFSAVLPEDRPAYLKFIHGSDGVAIGDLPRGGDADLGAIELADGGAVRATIRRGKVRGPLTAELFLPGPGSVPIAKKSLPADATSVTFSPLAPHDYRLVLRGDGPLQQLATDVTVHANVIAAPEITITPHRFHGRIFIAEESVPNASVRLRSHAGGWERTIQTNADGEFVEELWQPGVFVTAISGEHVRPQVLRVESIEGDGDIDWSVHLPKRSVHVTVTDAADDTPVGDAEIGLSTTSAASGATTNIRAMSDAGGHAEFDTVEAGRQVVHVRAEGYVAPMDTTFTFAESDTDRDVRVRLRRGVQRVVRFIDSAGQPVPNATVAEFASGALVSIGTADASGSMTLNVPAGETRTLYIAPPHGSFAVSRLEPARAGVVPDPITVTVPPGTAGLALTTKSTSGDPVPHVVFVIRFNGEILPLDFLQILNRVQGFEPVSDASGRAHWTHMPVGVYELWPAGSPAEVRAILAGAGTKAPVQLALQPGESSAVLTFTPAERIQ